MHSRRNLPTWRHCQFFFVSSLVRINHKSRNPKYLCLSFARGVLGTPNLARCECCKLVNAAKCQGYSFYHFWVIKLKPNRRCKIAPPTYIWTHCQKQADKISMHSNSEQYIPAKLNLRKRSLGFLISLAPTLLFFLINRLCRCEFASFHGWLCPDVLCISCA